MNVSRKLCVHDCVTEYTRMCSWTCHGKFYGHECITENRSWIRQILCSWMCHRNFVSTNVSRKICVHKCIGKCVFMNVSRKNVCPWMPWNSLYSWMRRGRLCVCHEKMCVHGCVTGNFVFMDVSRKCVFMNVSWEILCSWMCHGKFSVREHVYVELLESSCLLGTLPAWGRHDAYSAVQARLSFAVSK
jgi:hypothetical protein